MKNRLYLLLALTLSLCANLKAQELKTDVPVRKQFVENKIPGAVYAQPKQAHAAKSKGFEGSSLAKQIKEGKEEGMKYNFVTANAPKNPTGMSTEKTGALISNIGNGDALLEKDKTPKEPLKVSSQEEKKD